MTTFQRPAEFYTVSCPNNDGGKIVKIGFRDGHQRYRCKSCLKEFRNPSTYQAKRQFTTQQVGIALQGYFDGQSYREAARMLGRAFQIPPPDESTVYRWVQGYARGMQNVAKNLKVRTGPMWVADEMVVRVGGKKYWLWNVMDADSRYILSMHLSPRRTQQAAEVTFRKAIEASSTTPAEVRTDGLGSYGPAIRSLLPKTKHEISKGLDAENHNNLSERLQNTVRDRDKVLRGLDGRESGQNYLDGWVIDYNLFRPHMSLGERTPAQATGLDLPLRNWMDVAVKVSPDLNASRPEWHTVDEKPMATKEFRKMDIATAEEATRALRPKAFKSAFKARRGF